jgi:pimeloyl-ACP methyl ester carboxylesterase
MKRAFYYQHLAFILLVLASSVTAQKFPALPELKFAEIVNKDKFLGDRWSYMERGSADKPAIIALHGAGDNSMAWRFQLDGLSKNFRVIAWNAPGYMLTDGFKTESPVCRDYADALADFIQALKLGKVYLMGNSFGSRVAQCFGMYYPEKIIKIALIGVSAGAKDMSETEKNAIIQRRNDQIKDGAIAFSQKRVSALVGKNTSPKLIEIISEAMKATNKRAFLQVTTSFALATGYSPKEVGEKLQSEVLLIAGEEDTVTPIETNAKLLSQELKNSKLIILKGIGHLPHLEAAKEVNKLIKNFFK